MTLFAGRRAVRWVTRQSRTLRFSEGSVLWWSDAQSFVQRRSVAAEFGISGLAVWDLGFSGPIT